MYPVGNDYIQANNSNNRDTKITGTIKLTTGTVINIDSDSFKKVPSINNQCSGDDELILGQAYQGELTFEWYSKVDRYKVLGAEVTLSKSLRVNGNWVEVPLGTYIVSDCVRSGLDGLKITALDEMSKLDIDCPKGTVISGYVYDLLSLIARQTGITLGQTRSEIEAFPNGTAYLGITASTETRKYRDIAGDLAACLGGFVTVGRDRKLYVKGFMRSSCRTITADYRGKDTIADYQIRYTSVTCVKNGKKRSVGTSIGKSIDLNDNMFLQLGTDETTDTVLTNILGVFDGYIVVPSTLEYKMDDPAIELGDLITITGYTAGQGILVPVHKYDWTWRGKQKIISVGKDPRQGAKSRVEKQIESLQSKENKDKITIVSYFNASRYTVDDTWHQIANMRIGVMDSQIVLMHGVVKFDMLEAGAVKIRYRIDGEYNPFIHIVQCPTGENTITIFLPVAVTNEYVNDINIEIQSDDGYGTIDTGDVQVTLQGVGVTTGDWDGYIEIEETYSFPFHAGLGFSYSDDAEVETNSNAISVSASDSFAFPFHAGIGFSYSETQDTRVTLESLSFKLTVESGDGHLLTEEGGENIITEG